jgi:hypothetical protein
MVGSITGFTSFLKKEDPDTVTTQCLIHKELLVSKTLGDEMKNFWMILQKWLTLSKTSSLHNV